MSKNKPWKILWSGSNKYDWESRRGLLEVVHIICSFQFSFNMFSIVHRLKTLTSVMLTVLSISAPLSTNINGCTNVFTHLISHHRTRIKREVSRKYNIQSKAVLGGVMFSVLATGFKGCGFEPGRNWWIFKGDENPQCYILRRGSKAVPHSVIFYRMLKNDSEYKQISFLRPNSQFSSPVPPALLLYLCE
jgi:hypothetical protein